MCIVIKSLLKMFMNKDKKHKVILNLVLGKRIVPWQHTVNMLLKVCIVHVELELDRKEHMHTLACTVYFQLVVLFYPDPRRYSMRKGIHFS